MKKVSLILASSLMMLGASTQTNAQASKYGVTVDMCGFDYDEEDFCTDKLLKSYAKVLKNREANFDNNKILYIFETSESGYNGKKPYRLVVINKDTKTVSPLSYSLSDAKDSRGNPVTINKKGETIHFDFSPKTDKFCFSGNIDAYRNSYGYEDGPFCFKYDREYQSLVREY
ncbi:MULTISPECIES: hypothetical protein [Psychrobacter]|uniref:hypothetical protein n=1 Tax=Psychrobacter TaxID=497 RepID=UPI0017883566|nr:hypothetical protein [Psychrobacter sp. FME6]MBE0407708.1 hypothetical protein [Psychrobacter sp. FME6]